ncbi:hypothetical protein GGR58DRAFT_501106 [Xylaria digitata]|nr:hypothetical protein GGR58DRAFT_501106 [Xylaria digitata]
MPGAIVTNGSTAEAVTPTTKVAIWNLFANEHTDKLSSWEYRGPPVVKLFLHFEGQETDGPWALASGWLIRKDLVVTAGHCASDHSHSLGRLAHVKAYIGYHGNENINDSSYDVQFRTAKRVATTQSWLEKGTNEAYDVSFILLSSPFTNVTPITPVPTKQTGTSNIGVVGYPGDLVDDTTGEKGAFMWELFQQTSWDLSKSWSHMLPIQDWHLRRLVEGNSGSPVFLEPPTTASDAKSIGVHVYGGSTNSALVIGQFGNDFKIYTDALDAYASAKPPSGTVKEPSRSASWLTYIIIPSKDHSGFEDGPGTLGGHIAGVDEGFLDFLNKAVSVAAPIASSTLQVRLPMVLGPIGAPVSALAGLALNVAGKLAASATGTEADLAAIACLKEMGNAKCKKLGIFDNMNDIIKKRAKVVQGVAPKVLGVLAEPALRVTLDTLSKVQDTTEDTFVTPIRPLGKKEKDTTGFDPRLSENQEAFIEALTASLTKENTESFLSVASTVGKKQTPKVVVLFIRGIGGKVFGGRGSALVDHEHAGYNAEGLFDVLKKVVTTIGPVVLKIAPSVISAVAPIVKDLLSQDPQAIWRANSLNEAIPKGISSDPIVTPLNRALFVPCKKRFSVTRNYIKVFGGLSTGGVPSNITAPILTTQYRGLNADRTDDLRGFIWNLPQNLPANHTAVWFWLFILYAIESSGTAVFDGTNHIQLTSHADPGTDENRTSFAIPGGQAHPLTVSVDDYIFIIKDMMVALLSTCGQTTTI